MTIPVSPIADRYKDTETYTGPRGVEYGLYVPPQEALQPLPTWPRHTVQLQEVGFLDLIAVRYYGPDSEEGWFLIADANGIICPEYMQAGQVLIIPPREVYLRFVGRRGRA